jgi:putative redox protein
MIHQAQARSTTTPYIVNLSDPQGHHWQVDEPADKGGADTAPNPMQVLLSALGACTTVTLQMYAAQKQWPLESVEVHLALNPDGAPAPGTNHIQRRIELRGAALTDEQRQRLLQVAQACPVHKLLASSIEIPTTLG